MLEILKSADHVGAYRMSGTLSEDDYDRVIADVEARLDRHEKIGVFVDITGFHDLTLRAGLKDLRYSLGKIFDWNRFPKEAIVTDKQWVKTFAKFADFLIPFVELRSFDPEETERALAWVADLGRAEKSDVA